MQEYMIAGDDFANLRALLQNIGRMKGKTEETIRQEKVLARFKELEKTILICDFETAKQNLAALEEDKDVVKRLLSENITVWDILCRATDLVSALFFCRLLPFAEAPPAYIRAQKSRCACRIAGLRAWVRKRRT